MTHTVDVVQPNPNCVAMHLIIFLLMGTCEGFLALDMARRDERKRSIVQAGRCKALAQDRSLGKVRIVSRLVKESFTVQFADANFGLGTYPPLRRFVSCIELVGRKMFGGVA